MLSLWGAEGTEGVAREGFQYLNRNVITMLGRLDHHLNGHVLTLWGDGARGDRYLTGNVITVLGVARSLPRLECAHTARGAEQGGSVSDW